MTWDFVVVGGGSAGCVLANRLSEDPARRVLLLEAGGSDRDPTFRIPALGYRMLDNPRYMWRYRGEDDASCPGIARGWMTGRVVGGGSSVNGMVWVRGHAGDFDGWAARGCAGWDAASVLPYFKRAETFAGGADDYRGGTGPIHTSFVPVHHQLTDAFVEAAEQAGHAFTPDYNGARQEGVGFGQANVKRGFRSSTARAYLAPARRRSNLETVTGAVVTRVLVEGTRAVGVEYRRDGRLERALADREVILSAGALASPKLLMLSGIGPAAQLRSHGIEVRVDLPGVGGTLQEHVMTHLRWTVDVKTLSQQFTPAGIARNGIELLARGTGAAAVSYFHGLLFAKLRADAPTTEVELGFAPFGLSINRRSGRLEPSRSPVVTGYVILLHPRSRGRLELRSADPVDPPVIRHELLGVPQDLQDVIAGCRMMRDVMAASPIASRLVQEEGPGATVASDAEWEAHLRAGGAREGLHPSGTCRMGVDEEAVVDADLRVRGVEGLRVVDTSVLPELTSGNTNAPVIMVGERAADLVLAAT